MYGAGKCVIDNWDRVTAAWDIAYDIWRMLDSNDCSVVGGFHKNMYYKYWSDPGRYSSTAMQKTIAGAIDYALDKMGEIPYTCNVYYIRINHYDT